MKTYSAGALLSAIITAFVFSLLVAMLMLVVINHGRMINSKINGTIAFYRAQAGMEYAIYRAYTDPTWLTTGPYLNVPIAGGNVNITITTPGALSTYEIRISTDYTS